MRARLLLTGLALLVCGSLPAFADHPTGLDDLLRQVRDASRREAGIRHEREQQFLSEKSDRKAALQDMRRRVEEQRSRGASLKQAFDANEKNLQQLQDELATRTGNLGELFGTVRQSANDLHALLQDSLVSAQFPGRAEWFDVLAKGRTLPNVTELERFWLLMQQEIDQAGKVSRFNTPVTGTDGITRNEDVIRIGVFNVIAGDRFLRYLPENGRMVELPRQPAGRERATAAAYAAADSGYRTMVIDPARGDLLGLLVQRPTLAERIRQGGTVGYIIIAVGLFGLLLVILRLTSLHRVAVKVRRQLQQPDTPRDDNPLGRVLLAANGTSAGDIDAFELQLDEAILRETPALQRGLGLIKLLAAVAPLLGLLGTVTGMILTFQSISLFGTGDPKLMAGGISQALVTTVMGLVTAIPLLFFHTLMASRSRTLVQILDEQSAGLVARQAGERG